MSKVPFLQYSLVPTHKTGCTAACVSTVCLDHCVTVAPWPRALSSSSTSAMASPREMFEFDLNGYCVVRGALSAEEVGGDDTRRANVQAQAVQAMAPCATV